MVSLVTNIQGYSIHDGPGIRTVVFFKGCGLECKWCANPECISPKPEIGFVKNLCTKCGKCANSCSRGALTCEEGQMPVILRELCTGCGKCGEVCAYKALVLYGKSMSAGEIFDAIKRDKIFYDSSGGGVTVSGGESLLQPQVVRDLFEKCRQADIHTCIETSGFVAAAAFEKVLPFTDQVLYDLKIMDNEKHRKFTGKPNDLVLSNAGTVAESGVDMLFRMPLVPGVNDDLPNLVETAAFLNSLKLTKKHIELMPYHRLGKGKYDSLGKKYAMADLLPQAPEQIEKVKQFFEIKGITCTVSR